ncbi:trypsin-like [Hermetia illucens]|uniref:trypsin-like n=1 Tax=Hermetia illucens TaxID=343691 RepID=UPI0018CC6A96|nr:trypsin-like [Hermetia illucens]
MLKGVYLLSFLLNVHFSESMGRAPYYASGVTQDATLYKNFIVSVRDADDPRQRLCLGTIINRKLILTAAHCVVDKQGNKLKVQIVAGTFIENFESDPKAVIRNVSSIYVHPNYEHKAAANDLAVLELNNTLEYYNTNITSAAISDQIPDYPECYVFGWGCNTNTTHLFEKLQMKIMFIYDRTKCQRRYGANFYANELCADNSGTVFCANDTGGPLICKNKLVAVVSYLSDQEVYPNLFMLVSRHIGFIHNPVGMMQFYSTASKIKVKISEILFKYDVIEFSTAFILMLLYLFCF